MSKLYLDTAAEREATEVGKKFMHSNDVVGDICGVVSGSASATIAALAILHMELPWPRAVTLILSALVAGITVGGKAIGKSIAIGSCTKIVHTAGKLIYGLKRAVPKKKSKR